MADGHVLYDFYPFTEFANLKANAGTAIADSPGRYLAISMRVEAETFN